MISRKDLSRMMLYSFLLLVLLSFFPYVVKSQNIPFNSGFETGDLSEWDMIPNPNYSGNLSIVSEHQYQGNYCMKAIAGGPWAWLVAQKILDPPQELIYVRAYAKFVNIVDLRDFIKFIRIFNNEVRNTNGTLREFVQIRPNYYTDVGIKWGISYWDDSLGSDRTGTPIYVDRLGRNIQMDIWYQVEAMVKISSEAAELHLWVDGEEIWNKTDFSNVLAGSFIDMVHVGLTENPEAYPDAIMYIDAVAIDTQYIGSEPGKQTSIISCSVKPFSTIPYGELNVSGFVSPAVVETEVALIYHSTSGTEISRYVYTNSSGWYLDQFSPTQLGDWNVTASWAGNEDHWGAVSETALFSVREYASSISIEVYPLTIVAGEEVHVSGQITPPFAGADVTLCYMRPDNSRAYSNVMSSSEGSYSDTYVPYYIGVWTVQSSWKGNENYTSAESEIIQLFVNYPEGARPEIRNVEIVPVAPEYNQTTIVRAEIEAIVSDVGLVILSFRTNASWTNVTMVQEDIFYLASIPGFPYGTTVYYKIYASDLEDNWSVSAYSYNVTDLTPPSYEAAYWEPIQPLGNQTVTVGIDVFEPESASGVKDALIIFQVNGGEFQMLQMVSNSNTWTGKIPVQRAGAVVKFHVRIYDKAENVAVTPYYSYTVIGSQGIPLMTLILIGVITCGGTAVILAWLKVKGRY